MIEVARDAGLSLKTVSRVLNNERYVHEETREAVLASVKKLNYRRNAYARGLRAENSNIYALFYQNPMGGYHADILHGILTKCHDEGFHLVVELLRGTRLDAQMENFIAQVRLDGAVLTPPHCDNMRLLKLLKEYDVPTARISPGVDHNGDLSIYIDDEQAAYDITSYVLGRGHRRIGFIEGIPGHRATALRKTGYLRALRDAGITPEDALIMPGMFTLESGVEAGSELLRRAIRPSAVIASNDETAAGVVAAADELGLKVPGDVSVCGFDDSPIARHLTPTLTTISQPTCEFGVEAVTLLMQYREARSRNQRVSSIRKVMAHELIERRSVGDWPAHNGE